MSNGPLPHIIVGIARKTIVETQDELMQKIAEAVVRLGIPHRHAPTFSPGHRRVKEPNTDRVTTQPSGRPSFLL